MNLPGATTSPREPAQPAARPTRPGFARPCLFLAPVLAAALGWLLLGLAVATLDDRGTVARYVRIADDALAEEDYVAARVASERLVRSDHRNQAGHVVRLARSLAGLGNREEALTLVASLIPRPGGGLAPARLFLAEIVLNDPSSALPMLQMAEAQLQKVLAEQAGCAEAQELMGEYHYRLGNWQRAQEWFARAYPKRPDLAIWLSGIAAAQGNSKDARLWAEAASRHYEAQTARKPRAWRPRVRWAEAEWACGRDSHAFEIVSEGIVQSGHQAYRELAARLLAQQALRIARSSPSNLPARWQAVQLGLQQDPLNRTLLRELIRLTYGQGPAAREALATLQRWTGDNRRQADLDFLRGMDAWERGDLQTARSRLAEARQRDPENAVVANNLAFLLTLTVPPDLAEGLKLIDEALRRFPDSPVFHETRGQVYLRMGQWTNAASDLEVARRYFTNSSALHFSLAEVYEKLGDASLAARYRRMGEAFRRQ